jgi:hypothetical protein
MQGGLNGTPRPIKTISLPAEQPRGHEASVWLRVVSGYSTFQFCLVFIMHNLIEMHNGLIYADSFNSKRGLW